MRKHLLIIILFPSFIALINMSGYGQEPARSLPPSFITKIPPGPWCLDVINNRHYIIDCKVVDSLIKPKTIKSLKVETDGAGAAIYGYRVANGVVIIEIEKHNWKSEFPKLQPYLKDL